MKISENNEYGVRYKKAQTALILLKKNDEYILHGFYDKDDESIVELVNDYVSDKASGEVMNYSETENYCTIFIKDDSQLNNILTNSECYEI